MSVEAIKKKRIGILPDSEPGKRYGHEIDMPSAMPKPTSPFRAIRARCYYCAETSKAIRECDAKDCSLWHFRPGMRRKKAGPLSCFGKPTRRAILEPECTSQRTDDETVGPVNAGSFLRAIRKACLQCCVGSSHEVELCIEPTCPLFAYRFGKRPSTVARRKAQKVEAA
jgi:hypothetical protein